MVPGAGEWNSGALRSRAWAAMDTPVEGDVRVVSREKARRRDAVTPVSTHADESAALVTAYDGIRKDSEENPWEGKLAGALSDEETSSVGRVQSQ